jgi:aldose 1-epimerase
VAFGWHPYFRLPGVARRDLVVSLPARHHLVLDEQGLPTGDEEREPAEEAALGTRVFDDGYRLGRDRCFALSGGHTRLTAEFDRNYPYAQIFAPRGKRFVAFEPMTAPTNALVSGSHAMVEPGDVFTAIFRVSVSRI